MEPIYIIYSTTEAIEKINVIFGSGDLTPNPSDGPVCFIIYFSMHFLFIRPTRISFAAFIALLTMPVTIGQAEICVLYSLIIILIRRMLVHSLKVILCNRSLCISFLWAS
jgi:hypothetical protein